jgi:hypothetical protein
MSTTEKWIKNGNLESLGQELQDEKTNRNSNGRGKQAAPAANGRLLKV